MEYYKTVPSYSSYQRSSVGRNSLHKETGKGQNTTINDVSEQRNVRLSASAATKLTRGQEKLDKAGNGMSSVPRTNPISASSSPKFQIQNYRISKKPLASKPLTSTILKDRLYQARLAALASLKKAGEEKEKAEKEKEPETNEDQEKGKVETPKQEQSHDWHDMPPPSATFSRNGSCSSVSSYRPTWTPSAFRPSSSSSTAAPSRRSSSSTVAPSPRRSSFSRPPLPRRPSSTVPSSPSTPGHSGAAWAAERARNFKQANLDHMMRYGRSLVSRRPSDSSHGRGDLHPGILFSAAHHTPCTDFERNGTNGEIDCDDSYRTSTAFGVVHSKYRKFVAVRAVEYGIICLPIYTHQGTGSEHRRNQHEYMAVRDSRDKNRHEDDGRPFVTFYMDGQPNMPFLSPKAAILLTNPVFFSYSTSLTLEGRLLVEDIARLKDAFRRIL